MYIDVIAFMLAFIALMSIYSGFRWIKEAKKADDNLWLGLTQVFLGGVLFAIALTVF